MDYEAKLKIKDLLAKFCEGFDSNNKAANALTGVSSATISQVINNNWEMISEKMWLNIGKQVGYTSDGWKVVETSVYTTITSTLSIAKAKSRTHAILAGASWGKDTSAKSFKAENDNVWIINCSEFFNKKYFLVKLLREMGENQVGTLPELMERAIIKINKTHTPQIILNEADKLKDEVLYFFITFYNECEDKCSLILMATDQLEHRIGRGMFLGRKGYQEIFSRLNRRFIEIKQFNKTDVTKICMANGVDDEARIAEIFNKCDGDLRRVKMLVQNAAIKKGDKAA